jgi:cell division protein FtsX
MAEPSPRTRRRTLFLGGLRGGILGALISGLLAWGLVSGTSSPGTDWRAVLPTLAALLAMPFGFVFGVVIGAEAARRKLDK